MTPFASGRRWTLYKGDALDVLPSERAKTWRAA